jgi:hypothetical protein
MGGQRKHEILNHDLIDSIIFVRNNVNSANIGGVYITNYNLFIYRDTILEVMYNQLSKIGPSNQFVIYSCNNPLLKEGLTISKIEFTKTVMSKKYYLAYRDQYVVLSKWQLKVDDEVKHDEYKEPENYKSTQWQPKHVY